MKNIYILIIILAASIGISCLFYFEKHEFISSTGLDWQYKQKEIRSRLLSIPILLYHNIDGNGPFSIDLDVLRSHFKLIRDRGIRVIPLVELIQRLENPEPFREKVVVITFDDGYVSMYRKLLPLVSEFQFPVTLFVYTDFVRPESENSITWGMLREMDNNGIDIQCHTRTHQDLTLLSGKIDFLSKRKLYEEIFLSKKIIEQNLGKEVVFLAFPYGRYDLKIVDLAYKAGYRRVFSTDYGSNIITRDNYCLNRQHIKKNYTLTFLDRLIR